MTGAGVVSGAMGDHSAVYFAVWIDIEITRHTVKPGGSNLQPLVGMVFKTA